MINLIRTIFILSVILISVSYAYEPQKGKIDMHGGKGDKIGANNAIDMALGLGSVLSQKGTNKNEEENKKFIPLEKKDTIQNIESVNK